MISKDKKKTIIKDLTDKLSKQKTVVFSNYTGLSVNEVQVLRKKLKEQGIDYQVAKKTLIDLSLNDAGIKDVKVKELDGQVSVTIGYDDEILPAKSLYEYSKENENLKILCGIVDGKYLSQEEIISLAQLPSRPELLGKLVGSIAAPMSGLLNALEGNMRSLVYILKNIKPQN